MFHREILLLSSSFPPFLTFLPVLPFFLILPYVSHNSALRYLTALFSLCVSQTKRHMATKGECGCVEKATEL